MLDFDDFEEDACILMILKKMLDFDDFEEDLLQNHDFEESASF